MNLFNLFRRKKVVPQPENAWPGHEEFCRQVDFAVQLFELDPNTPEIQELKDAYDVLSTGLGPGMMWYIRKLNPNETVSVSDNGHIYIREELFGRVLKLWTIIRHHTRDTKLTMFVANGSGFHAHSAYGQRITAGGIPINPRRMADGGERYHYACELIREFTGIELDWRDHIGRTKTITVTLQDDGSWKVELDQLEPVG